MDAKKLDGNKCFELSDKLERMTILTQKIYAVAERLFMEQERGKANPLAGILFDYALDALKEADAMANDYCHMLLAVK